MLGTIASVERGEKRDRDQGNGDKTIAYGLGTAVSHASAPRVCGVDGMKPEKARIGSWKAFQSGTKRKNW